PSSDLYILSLHAALPIYSSACFLRAAQCEMVHPARSNPPGTPCPAASNRNHVRTRNLPATSARTHQQCHHTYRPTIEVTAKDERDRKSTRLNSSHLVSSY